MRSDSPLWKVGVFAAVVVVALASFVGGGYTYGALSDTESTGVEIGAAANFGTDAATNAPTPSGSTSTPSEATSSTAGNSPSDDGATDAPSSLSSVDVELQTATVHSARPPSGGVR